MEARVARRTTAHIWQHSLTFACTRKTTVVTANMGVFFRVCYNTSQQEVVAKTTGRNIDDHLVNKLACHVGGERMDQIHSVQIAGR